MKKIYFVLLIVVILVFGSCGKTVNNWIRNVNIETNYTGFKITFDKEENIGPFKTKIYINEVEATETSLNYFEISGLNPSSTYIIKMKYPIIENQLATINREVTLPFAGDNIKPEILETNISTDTYYITLNIDAQDSPSGIKEVKLFLQKDGEIEVSEYNLQEIIKNENGTIKNYWYGKYKIANGKYNYQINVIDNSNNKNSIVGNLVK